MIGILVPAIAILKLGWVLVVIWGVLRVFTVPGSAAQPEPTLAQELQAALDRTIEAGNSMGVSAAVVMPDGKVWFGVSGNSHPGTPISPDMVFSIESITKMFTAALILQLVEEGKLTLEDSLEEWLPTYPHIDGRITIRQLLNHTSGVTHSPEHPSYA